MGFFDKLKKITTNLFSGFSEADEAFFEELEETLILAALGSQLRRIYTARLAIDSGKDKYWLMELWEMKSDYPAKLLLSAAKKTTAAWCADAVRMCQVLDRRMKSEKGVDAVGELKLLLVRLGAQRR